MENKVASKQKEKSLKNSNELSFSDKILAIRDKFSLSQAELAAIVGGTGSSIGLIERGKTTSPSAEFLSALATKLSINPSWLLTGNGPMLLSEAPPSLPQNISSYPPDQNNVQAVGLLSEIPVIELGRVSFRARASFNYAQLQRFMNSDLFDKVLFRLPPGRTVEDYKDALVFDIEGDSMEPNLRDGQQVIAWPVPEGKWEYLHNTACVVDYDDTVTVKAIYSNDLFNTEGLTLHATGGKGGSFTVARKDIHSIWEVREFYGVVPFRLIP
ncbi:XRE family transcriptional regulator [Hymenobacter negativus]|uniref:Helix-turn-helix domain-containing protein n=1 Tax=Hymenobacter negativus TaxID=2795026 RepID=A0ABS3QDA1_9BACT|nr:helix-turn-helix domain-containing protein [Hymenobacter negativus]MBO2009210.1 helix-turn-helix domain-containing protein [Hymenobacter negativus]